MSHELVNTLDALAGVLHEGRTLGVTLASFAEAATLWPRMSAIARSCPMSVAPATIWVAAVWRRPCEVSLGSSVFSTSKASARSHERGRTTDPDAWR